MKRKSSLLAVAAFSALGAASSQGAVILLTQGVGVSTTNTDFERGANPLALTSLPVSASQSGGSYYITTVAVNAIATVASGTTPTPSFSLTVTNSTGGVLDAINFAGTVFQFKDNSANNAETLTASFTGITPSTPSAFNITLVANDGGASSTPNIPPLTKAFSASLTGLALADGASFTITWTDANDGGTDAMFGLGGLTVTPVPEPSSALLGGLGLLAVLRRRR